MPVQKIRVTSASLETDYVVAVGNEQLDALGSWSRRCLGASARQIALVSNPRVYSLYGDRAEASLQKAGYAVTTFLMKDGEKYKDLKTTEALLAHLTEHRLVRTDAVVALGGGVVGDVAGFASSIYLRGIPFLQVPTTLLAMVDSSVGGKTGVNTKSGKNLIGAFHQPHGVLIDPRLLSTLPEREVTAGLCEMVKHAAISGRKMLRETNRLLDPGSADKRATIVSSDAAFAELIARNVAFKASIVAGDERESSSRRDGRSRKILNFGHTLAHALEKITRYKYFKHGEAVGYGILFAAELSKELALLDGESVNSLNDVVHRAGTLPPMPDLDPDQVIEAFAFDKKRLAGSLQMVLLKDIGKPLIVSESEIPQRAIHRALRKLL